MANTVNLLSYANTFGDQLVTINALAQENNNMAANNYIKPTGTLYLNDPTLGLQVANNAVVAGQLQVQGTGSSAYIQNNLRVDTQVYFTNTTIGLTNSGQANINGLLVAQGPGVGLYVANNQSIAGNLNVTGPSSFANTLLVGGATYLGNTLSVVSNATVTGNVTAQNYVNVTQDVNAHNFNATGLLNSYGLNVTGSGSFTGQVSVGGNFVINGTTVYSTNTFTLNAGSGVGLTSYFSVNRGASANAQIRWNEPSQYWDIRDVNNPTSYSQILTANLISDSLTSTSSSPYIASQKAANTLNNSITATNTTVTNLNSALVSNVTTINSNISSNVSTINSSISSNVATLNNSISSNVTTLNSNITANVTYLQGVQLTQNAASLAINNYANSAYAQANATNNYATSAYNKANTGSGTFVGTTGIAQLLNGVLSFASNTGIVISATANTLYINDSQDLRTSASPSFSGLSLSGTPTAPTASISTNNTQIATTAYVNNLANSGITFAHNISGLATTATTASTANALNTGNSYQGSKFVATYGSAAGSATSTNYGIQSGGSNGGYSMSSIDGNAAALYTAGGSLYFKNGTDGSMTNKLTLDTSGNLTAVGNITAYSDARLKTNVQTITGALDKDSALRGVTFDKDGHKGLGVIAQEIREILPEVVLEGNDEDKTLSVAYGNIVGVLIEAIKELKAEIDELKKS